MTVLLSGATGLVGAHLARALVRAGHQVRAVCRNPVSAREKLAFLNDFVKWNGDQALPSEALNGVQAVVHLAGEPIAGQRWTKERKAAIWNSRVRSTTRLVQAINAQENPPEVFICASGVGYYGDQGDQLLNESSPGGGDFLALLCKAWEAEASNAISRHVRLRLGAVLAQDGGMLPGLKPIFRSGLAGKLGDGRQWLSWIHVDDLVELIMFALANSKVKGPLNAVAPHPVRNSEFTKAMAEHFHRPAIIPAPKWGLKLVLGEFAEVLLGSQRASAQHALDLGFQFKFSEIQAALQDLSGQA